MVNILCADEPNSDTFYILEEGAILSGKSTKDLTFNARPSIVSGWVVEVTCRTEDVPYWLGVANGAMFARRNRAVVLGQEHSF